MLEEQPMNIYAQTHTGLVQQKNEDRHVIKELLDGSVLLAVADGLGGEVSGDLAADMIKQKLHQVSEVKPGMELTYLRNLTQELDTVIASHARQHKNRKGMGSTLICVLIRNERMYWVHVGDSRLYHFHDNRLHQITKDQTLARFLFKEGEIAPQDLSDHYSQQVMDQCIGCGYTEPETGQRKIREKDVLLLSSDGLHKYIDNRAIETIIKEEIPVREKAQQLINASLQTGGEDNVTVIIAEV